MSRLRAVLASAVAILFAVGACEDTAEVVGPQDAPSGPSFATSVSSICPTSTSGMTITLTGNCTTDETLTIPDGHTLDGDGYTLTAVDPAGDHFRGAVVANGGSEMHVTDVTITTDGLANACDSDEDRLRGVMLNEASGTVTGATVTGINQGPSGCQEGNAIEVRNPPFDGTHPNTQTVEVAHNDVTDYQKTGIVANGDVDVSVHHNKVSESATQENLAANSVQLGFGALGSVIQNQIDGNQWKGTSGFVATAVLVFAAADHVKVSKNNVAGNSDVGLVIFSSSDGGYDNNRVFDEGADHPNSASDIGIWDAGDGTVLTNNKIRGFDTPLLGSEEGDNKIIPSPGN